MCSLENVRWLAGEIMTQVSWKASEPVRYLVGMVLAALVAYFTTTGAIKAELASMKAKQESQFEELLRRMDVLQDDIRELRRRDP